MSPVLRARGSAMTETIVLMLAALPLMFAIPMIGKLVDVNQTAVQAGRYATWEATVNHDGAPAPRQIEARFFGAGDEPILSEGATLGTNALWGDGTARPGGWDARTAIEIDRASVETIRYGDVVSEKMTIANAAGDIVQGIGDLLAKGDDVEWGLGDSALVRSGVRVRVRENGWLEGAASSCGGAFACLEETGAILSDGWSAGDVDQVKRRVRTLVPARVLHKVGDGISLLGALPFLKEAKHLKGAFGHVGEFVPPHAERDADTYGLLPEYVEE